MDICVDQKDFSLISNTNIDLSDRMRQDGYTEANNVCVLYVKVANQLKCTSRTAKYWHMLYWDILNLEGGGKYIGDGIVLVKQFIDILVYQRH